MAFDSEAFEERRRLRKEAQEKRKRQQKKMRLRLILAAVALVLVIVAIFLLTRGEDAPAPVSTVPPQVQATEGTEPAGIDVTSQTTEPLVQDTVIHLAAAGDLNITDRVVAAGGSTMDYTQAFMDVGHLLGNADVAVLNLEGNLVGEPYGGTYFSAPQSLVQTLGKMGVDLIQLANSYSIRNGMSGLSSTIDGVRAAGMEPLGVYASREEYEENGGYTIVTVKGIRIAFVAFTKGMDGMTLPPDNTDCVNILYTDYDMTYQQVDFEKIGSVLAAVDREEPDLVVAMLHWGSEYNDTISSSQEEICEFLQTSGVDAIIGTHSHYVQQMTFDPQKGQFLAYSLGDFFGDAGKSGSEYSVILDLEITKDGQTGKCKITGYDYTPIFTVAEGDGPLRVMRIHETMRAYEDGYIERVSSGIYEKMEYALKRIEARINGE